MPDTQHTEENGWQTVPRKKPMDRAKELHDLTKNGPEATLQAIKAKRIMAPVDKGAKTAKERFGGKPAPWIGD